MGLGGSPGIESYARATRVRTREGSRNPPGVPDPPELLRRESVPADHVKCDALGARCSRRVAVSVDCEARRNERG